MSPRRANSLINDPPTSLPQRQQFLNGLGTALTATFLLHGLMHKLSQYRAFVLTTKYLVERFLHIGRSTEIHRRHSDNPLVETLNNRMAVNEITVKIEEALQQLNQEEGRRQRHAAKRVANFNDLATCAQCQCGRLFRVGQYRGPHCTMPGARE